ncbi:MAG: helix-turn-helix transcriptional regulator [Elusimicrobia bacterium]|nr:helix-turn-helix transcriptional regulator [Elusimicrobiota bacterium]
MSRNNRFAGLVQEGMRVKNLSLRALCRKAGVDPSLMSKILAGKRNPPDDDAVIDSMARSLELDPVELYVSVDRLPPQWRSVGSNPELFEAVRELLEGGRRAPRAAVLPPIRATSAPSEKTVQDSMPEELL